MSKTYQQLYIQKYLPIDALCVMYCAKKPLFVYRHLALSWDDHFWHDTKQEITSEALFRALFYEKLPRQIHFSRFRYSHEHDKKSMIEEKELVFDIDITDFKRYCPCGENKTVCSICWLHIEGAALVLRYILLNIMAIEERYLLWVFSGKKGFHCVINESTCMKMGEDERTNLHRTFSIETDSDMKDFIQMSDNIFLETLESLFYERVIIQRQLLSIKEFQSTCLQWIANHFPSIYSIISLKWSNNMNSIEKWDYLRKIENEQYDNTGLKPTHWIIMQCYFPPIDSGPMGLNRNFKLPFSIHGTTEKLAIPINYKELQCNDGLPGYTLKSLISGNNDTKNAYNAGILHFSQWINQY